MFIQAAECLKTNGFLQTPVVTYVKPMVFCKLSQKFAKNHCFLSTPLPVQTVCYVCSGSGMLKKQFYCKHKLNIAYAMSFGAHAQCNI